MLRLSLPDPQYAVKTAWRFVALVFCMSLLLVLAAMTTPWWVRVHEMAWFIFAVLFCMSLIVLLCFAFAGVGWALCAVLPVPHFAVQRRGRCLLHLSRYSLSVAMCWCSQVSFGCAKHLTNRWSQPLAVVLKG
jgi:hypothetical protein